MTSDNQKKILIDYLNMKVLQEDWRSVEDAARDLRALPQSNRAQLTDRTDLVPPKVDNREVPPQAIPPVEMEIPHHANEVLSLLRMSDTDLVDRMFPDFTQEKEA